MGALDPRAVPAFLNRPRSNWAVYKRLKPEALDRLADKRRVDPAVWQKLRLHQKIMLLVVLRALRFALWADTGCVGAETLIETDRGPIRIDELYRRGKPLLVWARTQNGLRLVEAECPFQLGPTALFEIRFASGRIIVVTARHRFLTDAGWLSFFASQQLGARLPVFDACHPQSSSDIGLSEFQPSAHRCCHKQTDCLVCYCQGCCLYDGLPPNETANAPTFSPLPTVIPEHSPLWSHSGDWASECTNSLSSLIGRPSKNHFASQESLCYNCKGYPEFGCVDEPYDGRSYTSQPTQSVASRERLNNEAAAFGFGKDASSFDSIASVRFLRYDVYYDIHVPVYENYIAHGLCHHNSGKTITTLAVALHLQRRKQIRHVLVLVPRKANKEEWKLEIEKHFPNLSYCIMPSETEAKHLMLGCSDALVTIETYSGLYYLACEKVKDQRRGRKGRNRLDVSPRLMRALTDKFDGIVLDESHGAKSKNKLPFRICNRIATNAKLVMALSATPLGRDPTDLWGQMRMVDGGETLGETLALFRAAFFSEQKDLFGTAKFIFKKSKSGLLNRILNNRSIRFEADEADLPKVVEIVKKFSLPEDAETYYRRAVTTMRESVGNYREQKNAWLRMRQISSGFVGFKDDDTGKSAQFTFPDNPKLELLLTLLESVDDKAIVFYEYTWSGLRIIKELHRLGIGALHLYGKTKDQGGARRRFNDDPNVRVLVMQNSFGEGLNLQAAKYGFFYESPVRPDVRKQCRRRFERQDSKHKHVFSYDLVCADSVDESILKAIKEGNDLFRQIIDGKAII